MVHRRAMSTSVGKQHDSIGDAVPVGRFERSRALVRRTRLRFGSPNQRLIALDGTGLLSRT
jgi:hypothetical protein